MKKHFSNEKSSLVDCRENEVTPKQALRGFWDGFENYEHRYGEDELPFIYKLKGTNDDFKQHKTANRPNRTLPRASDSKRRASLFVSVLGSLNFNKNP